MAEKRESIEELGKREAEYERELGQMRETQLANAGKLADEVPGKFFELCGMVREAVRRFNQATDQNRRLTWRESPALAARDKNLNGDFNCEFGREGMSIVLALNAMSRSGKPDAYVIEGYGQIIKDRFLLRVEGLINKQGQVVYRILVDFQRIDCTLEELAERLVIAMIKQDYKIILRG